MFNSDNNIISNKEELNFTKSSSEEEEIKIHQQDQFINTTIALKKKFIGGYKNKLTNKVYHHAVSQTMPSPWKYELILKFHRDSQTVKQQNQIQQTPKDACTQVQGRNIFIGSSSDKFMSSSSNFQSFDELNKIYLSKIIVLQSYIRRWLAQKRVKEKKKNILLQQILEGKRLKFREQLHFKWLKYLQERRINPKTEEDFKLMFSDLQKWWEKETKSIAELRNEKDLRNASLLLVDEEVQKIVDINWKKKIPIQKQNSDFKELYLEKAAEPNMWKGHNFIVEVETNSTQKGRHLKELYNTLCMKYVSSKDRIDSLSTLKEVLQPYQCKLSESLLQLANREIDLLERGTKIGRLDGLRKRIQDLFWQFAKQPSYNPQIQVLEEKNTQPKSILCCASCKQFYCEENDVNKKTLKKSVLENYFVKCEKCKYIENEAWLRKDFEFYKKLLKSLCSDELNKGDHSNIIHILQPRDIMHLVDKIWKRQSCLSGSSQEDQLELVRYKIEKSWTPWNCLLVTRKENETLEKTLHSEKEFNKKFKKCVAQKHAEAIMHFSGIPRFFPFIYMKI